MVTRIALVLQASLVLLTPAVAQTAAKPRIDALGDPLPDGAIARLGTERLRPAHAVTALSFSADGKILASLYHEGFVDFWDTTTGLRGARLALSDGFSIKQIAFSQDGKYLAALGFKSHSSGNIEHSGVWLWHVADLGPPRFLVGQINDFQGFFRPATSTVPFLFSPDSKMLLTCMLKFNVGGWWDTVIELWNPDNGVLKQSLVPPDDVTSATFLDKSRKLVTFGGKSKLRVWDIDSSKLLQQLEIKNGRGPLRRLADDKSVQILGYRDGKTSLETWNMATLERTELFEDTTILNTSQLSGFASPFLEHLPILERMKKRLLEYEAGWSIQGLAVSADGKRIALATKSRIFLWDSKTGNDLLSLASHDEPPRFIRFLADNKTVLTANADQTVRLWDATKGNLVKQFDLDVPGSCGALDFSAATNTLLAFCNPSQDARHFVALWDVTKGKKTSSWSAAASDTATIRWHAYYSSTAAISPDGKTLAVIDVTSAAGQRHNGTYRLRMIDATTGQTKHEFSDWPGDSAVLRFSPDGTKLAIWDHSGGLTPKNAAWVDTPAAGSPAAATFEEWQNKLLNERKTAQEKAGVIFVGHASYFAGDSQVLGLADFRMRGPYYAYKENGIVSVAPGKIGSQKQLPQAPQGTFLAVVPGLQAVVVGYYSHEPLLRNLANGKLLARFRGHQTSIQAAAISANGKFLATACQDGTVLIWDIAAVMKHQRELYAPLPNAKLEALWNKLGNQPDGDIDDTLDALVAAYNALPFLQGKLKPVSTAQLKRCLAALDSNSFSVREKATAELGCMEFAAKKALQDLLAAPPSLEVSQRVKKLLADLEPKASPHHQASWRALAALEQIDTPQARKLLEALAKGAPEARLTREAQAVVQRFIARQD